MIIKEIARLLPELTDADRCSVLVKTRLLLLRKCMVAQYIVEWSAYYRNQYTDVHWVRPYHFESSIELMRG